MAKAKSTNPIAPFPDHIDRDAFGHWLSGFTDGEGCFGLYKQVQKHPNGVYENGRCYFVIRLRADERPALELIRSYLQCGAVYDAKENRKGKKNPQVIFHVTRPAELVEHVIPHFEQFPLRAKKRDDYVIWKQGVELAFSAISRRRTPLPQRGRSRGSFGFSPKWSADEKAAFFDLIGRLREGRLFHPAAITSKSCS